MTFDLHGKVAGNATLAEQAAIDGSGAVKSSLALIDEDFAAFQADAAAPIVTGVAILFGLGPVLGTISAWMTIPLAFPLFGVGSAFARLARNQVLRVRVPPHMLIVEVQDASLGGITNPTPAAAFGAGEAIMSAVNLPTSVATPPCGFALFHLRGAGAARVTSGSICHGVVPFGLIHGLGLPIPESLPPSSPSSGTSVRRDEASPDAPD